ncbi:MAG: UDP-N-acetylmuramate dehydrogenase [Candidatus Omnitrophica bacterium]|nr:UDP-N-acetylmuramate dehydrogenase [Candidatus Omnitrophota bacterium]
MQWWKNLKKPGKLSEPLKNHTTFRIGGAAQLFFRPHDLAELRQIVRNCSKRDLKILVLGAGSNLLVSDKGARAAVIKLDSLAFRKTSKVRNILEAGAGKPLNQLLTYCRVHGLSGLEFMAGIPGTIGGALAMNAGVCVDKKLLSIGDLVESVRVLDYNGNIKILEGRKLKFGYRRSNLAKYIILSARFKLNFQNSRQIQDKINDYLVRRRNTRDYSRPNAGCIFKNPPGDSAGRLIDACGLKGKKIGGAVVSSKHANFILNQDRCSAKDVLALVKLIQKVVKKKYGVLLEPEIKIWK